MVHKIVTENQNPITTPNSTSSHQYAQELARNASHDAFFVADLTSLPNLINEWRAQLPRVEPYYAINCNADIRLLKVLSSYGLGFHCSSRQQKEIALDFLQPQRLSYTTVWTRSRLDEVNFSNIGLLGFDSAADLRRMAKAKITNKLILNIRLSGDESVFGCDVSEAPELLQLASDFGLDCIGIGFNLCAQRLGLFDSIFEYAARLFAIGRSMGLNMQVMNLGGGFPSPFSRHSPSFEQICEQTNTSLDYYFPSEEYQNMSIIATPGRFFASSVFTLATRIVDRFETDASQITNDDFDANRPGFIYKISEGYYGPFGCSIVPNCYPECLPLFEDETSELFYGRIHGPSINDEFDVVQEQCQLRQLMPGEWLLWDNMGSYSIKNADSLDEPCTNPQVYYFSNDSEWKFANDSDESCGDDGGSETSEDSAIADLFWTLDWQCV